MSPKPRQEPDGFAGTPPHSEVPLCRICQTVLEQGICPACKRRAARFAKVLAHTPPPGVCQECGAPTPPPKRPGGRSKKRCGLCAKLVAREVYLARARAASAARGRR